MTRNSKEKSVLLEHPLLVSYCRLHKIKNKTEKTKFPLGLMMAVYQDYTGMKVVVNQKGEYRSSELVEFGDFFSQNE